MNDRRANPSSLNQFISIAVILGCFLVFGFLLFLIYMPDRPESFSVGSVPPGERSARLIELRAGEDDLSGRYSWVDRDKGIVRMPIKRAMDLALQELNEKPHGVSTDPE